MNGLEASNASNGWAMALAGASIVLCGLTVLSFAISLIPKILALFEKEKVETKPADDIPAKPKTQDTDLLTGDIAKLVKQFQPLLKELGSPFQLGDLYKITKREALPHSHLSIKRLREEGILISKGKGQFTWET